MLITPIDILFVIAGLAVMGLGFRRQKNAPPPESAPPASVGEIILTGLALVTAAVGPNVLVVALTPGMPGMPTLTRWVLIPSIALFILVWSLAFFLDYKRLQNRIWTGLWVGASTTAALDVFRLTSFSLGLLPGNMPRMFGVLIFDTMALGPTPFSDLVGALYHYWVSACFGLTYALICGRTRWWGGLIWGLIIEVGMMTTPPMVIAMDTGYFGLKLGQGILNGVFIGSLIPHISYGIALGLLSERYIKHQGSIFRLIRQGFGVPYSRPVTAKVLRLLFLVFFCLVPLAQAGETNKTALLKIDGITWVFCAPAVQGLLTKLDGVKKADVNWEKGEVVVEYDPLKVTTSQMIKAVNQSGVFKVKAVEDPSGERGVQGGGKK